MFRFILRRLLQMIPLLLGITFISFVIMKMAPGDYLTQMSMNPQVSPETLARLRHAFGLDQPWYVQYFIWLKNAVTGNFGYSFSYHLPVFTLIGQYVWATLLMAVAALVISWVVALPLGIFAATHKNGTVDKIASFLSFSFISTPSFFAALLALIFAQKTGWLPVGGMQSPNYASLSTFAKIMDVSRHLILPALVLGTRSVASIMRQMRVPSTRAGRMR